MLAAQQNLYLGSSVYLWNDVWNMEHSQSSFILNFFLLLWIRVSLYRRLKSLGPQFHRIFHIPLSDEAFVQYMEFQNIISNLPSSDGKDRWEYIWGTGYFCSKAYKHLKGHMEIHPAFRWLWKSVCQLKHKIFFWLLMQDKLIEHKRSVKKKKYGPRRVWMCCLWNRFRGECWTSLLEMPLCNTVLGITKCKQRNELRASTNSGAFQEKQ